MNNTPALRTQLKSRGRNRNILEYLVFHEEMGALTLQEAASDFTGIIADGHAQTANLAVGELNTLSQVRESCLRGPLLGHEIGRNTHK